MTVYYFLMLEAPSFEKATEEQTFNKGDEIYFIDKNKSDIYLAEIQQVQENGYLINFKDHEAKPKTAKKERILPKTVTNDQIYLKQKENREMQIKEDENDKKKKGKASKKDDTNESEVVKKKKTKVKKVKKQKKPLLDYNLIIRTAWQKGIQNPDQFKKFIKKNVKKLYDEYETYYNTMNINTDDPLFQLGGYDELNDKSDQKEVKKFWSNSRTLWTKLFDNSPSVRTIDFVKKLIELLKLPNQTESNARAAIEFFFNPDEVDEVNYASFCAFLALFAPHKTALRKIRDFFNIAPEFSDKIVYTDPVDFVKQDLESEINCIEVYSNSDNSIFVYNLPSVQYGEDYLVDDKGNKYKTWNEFFKKNPMIQNENEQKLKISDIDSISDDSSQDDDSDDTKKSQINPPEKQENNEKSSIENDV